MKNKLFTTIITLLVFSLCKAQNLPSIQTDRPDQTECPFITPINYFQFENGFYFEKKDNHINEIAAPTTLTRFGINDHFEVRLITEYLINKDNSQEISGINPVLIGFKTRLFEEKGIIPLTSFIGHIGIPKLASSNYKVLYYAPEFRFTIRHPNYRPKIVFC